MSTNTIDPMIKIRNLEREACNPYATKDEYIRIFNDMMYRTKVELKEIAGSFPPMCPRFIEMEKQYGKHKIKF